MIRALDYRAAPFEATMRGSGKVYFASAPFSGNIDLAWPVQGKFKPHRIYLSCSSSDETNLPNNCIDFIVTDPPFFDNVHYSELADFFYAWQRLYPRGFLNDLSTTRHAREVQDANADSFAGKLKAVFAECHRVLKDNGILSFTYHHSRAEGWTSLVEAIFGAEFSIINAHPVKAEMSVAAPKSQAKEPIQLDVVLVCKKKVQDTRTPLKPLEAFHEAVKRADQKLARLAGVGLKFSENDRRVTIISQFISALGPVTADIAVQALLNYQTQLDQAVDDISRLDETLANSNAEAKFSQPQQMTLPF